MVTRRLVLLVCGPMGAGKTTYAHSTGLPVFDLDDEHWQGNEEAFRRALRQLGADPAAHAVVIRSGARIASRRMWARTIDATDPPTMLVPPKEVAIARVIERNRPRPSMRRQIAAVHAWYARYEPEPLPLGAHSRPW